MLEFERINVHLTLTKYLPISFYSLDSLPINCYVLQYFIKFWNMAFKWIYGLRKYDSTRLMFQSCNTMSAKFLLHWCLLLFYNSISVSSCLVVHSLWRWFGTVMSLTVTRPSYV
jgi:hypothetical protein